MNYFNNIIPYPWLCQIFNLVVMVKDELYIMSIIPKTTLIHTIFYLFISSSIFETKSPTTIF